MKTCQRIAAICAALVMPVGAMAASVPDFVGQIGKTIGEKLSGPKIEVTVDHPPTLPLKVSAIAIAKAEGQCGEDVSARIEEDFVQSGVTVIDRQRYQELLAEHKIQANPMTDQRTAAKVGKLLGVQALLFVNVLECTSHNRREESYTDKETGRTVYNHVTEGVVRGSVRVVDLTTGRVLAAQHFRGTGTSQSTDGYLAPEAVISHAHESAAESIHRMLLPWNETKSLVFFDDGQCDLKKAARLLKIRDVDGAMEQSATNLEKCRETASAKPRTVARAYYNLGMLQFMKRDFDAALTNLSEADKIENDRVFLNAIKECREARELATTLAEGGAAPAPKEPVTQESSKMSSLALPLPKAIIPQIKDKSTLSLEKRLGKLEELRKSKIITQAEYDKRRDQLLNEI